MDFSGGQPILFIIFLCCVMNCPRGICQGSGAEISASSSAAMGFRGRESVSGAKISASFSAEMGFRGRESILFMTILYGVMNWEPIPLKLTRLRIQGPVARCLSRLQIPKIIGDLTDMDMDRNPMDMDMNPIHMDMSVENKLTEPMSMSIRSQNIPEIYNGPLVPSNKTRSGNKTRSRNKTRSGNKTEVPDNYHILALQWRPADCPHDGPPKLSIHGLWPQQKYQCSALRFDLSELYPLKQNLTSMWPSRKRGVSNTKFLKNEWKRHGAISHFRRPTDYFNKTIQITKKINRYFQRLSREKKIDPSYWRNPEQHEEALRERVPAIEKIVRVRDLNDTFEIHISVDSSVPTASEPSGREWNR